MNKENSEQFSDDDSPHFQRLTPEQQRLLNLMCDTKRDTTQDGRPRCAQRYLDVDDFGDVVWMRCVREAKVKVWVTDEDHEYWALACYGCCPHSDQIEELCTPKDGEVVSQGTAVGVDPSSDVKHPASVPEWDGFAAVIQTPDQFVVLGDERVEVKPVEKQPRRFNR